MLHALAVKGIISIIRRVDSRGHWPPTVHHFTFFSFCILCKKERRNKVTSQTTVQPSSTSAQARLPEVTWVTSDPQQHDQKHSYKRKRTATPPSQLVKGWKTTLNTLIHKPGRSLSNPPPTPTPTPPSHGLTQEP